MLKRLKSIDFKLLPLMALFLLLPLCVRLVHFKLDPITSKIMHLTTHKDWFFYYKSLGLILITLWMLITVLFVGRKMTINREKPFSIYYFSGLALIFISTLSTFLSPYKDLAIIGGPTRFEGLGIVIGYIMIMFYAMIFLNDSRSFRWLTISFGILVGIQTFIGITQFIGYDFLHWRFIRDLTNPGEFERTYYSATNHVPWFLHTTKGSMQGTLGNSNYSGSFISLALPFFLSLSLLCSKFKAKLTFSSLTVCSLFIAFACNSRAGLVGIGLSFLIGIILFFRVLKSFFTTQKKLSLGLSCLILISLVSISTLSPVQSLLKDFSLTLNLNHSSDLANSKPYLTDFNLTPYTLKFMFKNHEPIIMTLSEEALSFSDDSLNRMNVLKTTDSTENTEPSTYYELRHKPYHIYGFNHSIKENGHVYVDFILNNQIMCHFVMDSNGVIDIINPITLEPLSISKPPHIGFEGKERIGSSRGYIWSRSLPLLTDTLLLGYGPDMYMLQFPQDDFFGKLYTYNNPFMTVDKPHNTYLQLWINQGFIAFIAFIIIVLTYISHSFKLYAFRSSYTEKEALGIACLLAITGYLGASFFNDTTLSVTPLFWALLGMGIAYNRFYKVSVPLQKD